MTHAAEIYSGNRKTIKLHCCSSFPSHGGKQFFSKNIAKDVLTQWFFILPPLYPLMRVFIVLWEHEGKSKFRKPRMTKTLNRQTVTILVGKLSFITDRWFWNEKEILFFFLSLPIFHTAGNGQAGMLVDTKLKFIFRLKICKLQAKQQEIFATGKIKHDTSNLYSVISWAR